VVPRSPVSHDSKPTRRHLLLNSCRDTHGGTLAAASRNGLEHQNHGAVCYELRHPTGVPVGSDPGTGVTQTVYVYPARLIYRPTGELRAPEGDSRRHLGGARRKVAEALGAQEGPTTVPHGVAGSRRGRIVRFADTVAAAVQVSHGLVITQHAYSERQRQQVVVPLLGGHARVDASDVVTGAQTWLEGLTVTIAGVPEDVSAGISLVVSLMFSVNQHEGDIAEELDRVADAETMARVMAVVGTRLGLPRPAPRVGHDHLSLQSQPVSPS